MKLKITAKTIDALTLPVGKDEEVHWDANLTGFGLRLRRQAGTDDKTVLRTWVVQYKRAGRTRKVTIGKANVLGVEAARTAARTVLAKVALGEDPAAERRDRDARDRNTLRSLVDAYLAAKKTRVRPRTFTEAKRYLTSDYFRPLHNLPIDTVRRADVAANVVRIERESGSPTAREARGALSTFFVWAMQMGLCESNPTIGAVRPAANEPRSRVLSDNELAAIWKACGDDEYSKIIRLLILTGCRRQEIGDLRWSEFPPDLSSFTIPASRSKNKRPHTLPVMPLMRTIIESVPRMASRDALFGLRSHGFTNWTLPKPDLDRRAGVADEWHLHDVRRSVATKMADIGVPPHIIEAVLNHFGGFRAGDAGTYNRSPYEREVRNALAMWERYIELVTDRDLYAAHQAFLARGDDQAREKAGKAFRDAIAAGGGHWEDYTRTLIEGGERKVLNFQPPTAEAG